MTRVVLPGALRGDAGGAGTVQLDLPPHATVGDLLDALGQQHPALERRIRDEQGTLRRFVNLYVDGDDVRGAGGVAAPVGPQAEVLVLPSIAGG